MLYTATLNEIESNINTGVEYEIALFAKFIESNKEEYQKVVASINKRYDKGKVMSILHNTNIKPILDALAKRNLKLKDATFETQNDNVGPADIVMIIEDKDGNKNKIGLSVKYANTCTLNVAGRKFITEKK